MLRIRLSKNISQVKIDQNIKSIIAKLHSDMTKWCRYYTTTEIWGKLVDTVAQNQVMLWSPPWKIDSMGLAELSG